VRVARLVAHPVRELGQRGIELVPGVIVGHRLLERTAHAEQPRIALGIADRKSHVPLPQPRVAFFGRIELWAAGPFAQVSLEDILDRTEIRRMHGPDRLRLG